ncbi:restriction endonuclease [Arthrobacter sp. H-02-3]|uniref:restriction endonuclease n=1 Tax=Arthrobacter sp. H-02-3 TaxID=2703675 RepID=UPI000DD2B322|nr:restriction endonuclease [Arthrobacter sp. H-02-3]PVZ61237.1 restriction endonuclease [Arthrobacter sp. H-02-3]
MDLADALATFDKVAVNLEKLERVWQRAQPHVPTGPAFGTTPEYTTLARNWDDLLAGLPPIDGWKITAGLPDTNEIGQLFLDYADIGELPRHAWDLSEQPNEDLAKYRHLLDRARRKVIASRLTELSDQVTQLVAEVVAGIPSLDEWIATPPAPRVRIETPQVSEIESCLAEVERLLGQTVERKGRWAELRRHLHFGEVNDWHDIAIDDWPSVQSDIEAAKIGEVDPVPVPDVDLGEIGNTQLTGQATTALNWAALNSEGFERLLFDILRDLNGYQNVEWLMNTNAPDRGRDISLQRVFPDASGTVRTERVIVQAKHYTSKAVSPIDIQSSLASLSTWEPPVIRYLIIATSSRFSADAVLIVDKHNVTGKQPEIEMWPASKLEVLLSQRPKIAITYGLRA